MITQRRLRFDGKVLASCTVLALVVQLSADSASTGADVSRFEKKFVEVVEGKITEAGRAFLAKLLDLT